MKGKSINDRIILGLKVKQLRSERGLSLQELAGACELSTSYLNEIEKGKKYPKPEKLGRLAEKLGLSAEQLASGELYKNLAPVEELLRSNFLNDLPLEFFGIEKAKVVEIIAGSPAKVTAFISTLLELSRNYALNESNFYYGALRAFLELNLNYFDDLEKAVSVFALKHGLKGDGSISVARLSEILEQEYGYKIVQDGLADDPDLQGLRAIFHAKKRTLLLNKNLKEPELTFELGKELAFNCLELHHRANTSSLLKPGSFDQVLEHAKAIYFAVALMIDRGVLGDSLRHFFQQDSWRPDLLQEMLEKFKATPEMLYHRVTNLLPKDFGLEKLFFLRFTHDPSSRVFEIDRELHLNRRHKPHASGLSEHYCRRWIAVSLLEQLSLAQKNTTQGELIFGVQRSTFMGSNDEYLCISTARAGRTSTGRNVSLTIGILLGEESRKVMAFADDPAIVCREVNHTCERCGLQNCADRAAPPVVVERKRQQDRLQQKIDNILEK